jgi:hypothetical protein
MHCDLLDFVEIVFRNVLKLTTNGLSGWPLALENRKLWRIAASTLWISPMIVATIIRLSEIAAMNQETKNQQVVVCSS